MARNGAGKSRGPKSEVRGRRCWPVASPAGFGSEQPAARAGAAYNRSGGLIIDQNGTKMANIVILSVSGALESLKTRNFSRNTGNFHENRTG